MEDQRAYFTDYSNGYAAAKEEMRPKLNAYDDMLAALKTLIAPRGNGLYCYVCVQDYWQGKESHAWDCPIPTAQAAIAQAGEA